MTNSDYPEHEKLQEISDKSQTIGEFLDWLQNEKGITIAKYDDSYFQGDVLMPAYKSIPDWLAEYFEIDQDKIEEEKRAMLQVMRDAHV